MPRFAIVPQEAEDEILYSFLMRTARANGFNNTKLFFDCYHLKKPGQSITYEYRWDIYRLIEAISKKNEDVVKFYLKTEMFSGIAPFATRELTSHRIGVLCSRPEIKKMLTKTRPVISHLKCCPICQQEDKEKYGYWYYHRAHQMPEVTTCYKHGCKLKKFIGNKGNEFSVAEEDYEDCRAYSCSEEYARWCKEVLDAGIQYSITEIRELIKYELRCKKYLPYGQKRLIKALKKYDDMVTADEVERFLKTDLCQKGYANIKMYLFMLMFVFSGDVSAMIKGLKADSIKYKFAAAIYGEYELVSEWREDIVELRCCTCGTRFITTPARILAGWGCPECDSKITQAALFKRLFDIAGQGEYELLSEFHSMNEPVRIRHIPCGKIYSIKPRAFLFEKSRCQCNLTTSFEEAQREVDSASNGTIELLQFSGKQKDALFMDRRYGHNFWFNYTKFIQRPYCKICAQRVRTENIFKREIKNLTGNEYSLAGKYKDKDTKVGIQHNVCGRVQDYYPRHFLDGERCSYCHPFTKLDELIRIIKEKSNGRYQYGGKKSENLHTVIDTVTGVEKNLTAARIMQELNRPTPSRILPLEAHEKNTNVAPPMTHQGKIESWIKGHYKENEVICIEDVQAANKDISNSIVKYTLKNMVSNNILQRIEKGVYCYANADISPEQVVHSRYIERDGHRIGYLSDLSFAYALGLRTEKPEKINIVSNIESQQHGRNRTYAGLKLKIHGSRTEITDENYAVLAVMSFVINEKRLKACTVQNKKELILKWLDERNVKQEDFESYYQYYPKWTSSMIAELYREEL